MRLRWKFFLVLLGFSLLPLAAVTGFTRGHMERLGRSIADEGRAIMAEIVKNELRQTAEDYALVLRRTKSAMDFSLTVLAAEAERSLAGPGMRPAGNRPEPEPPTPRIPDPVRDTTDPPGDNSRQRQPETLERLALFRPEGTRASRDTDARLASLEPTFAMLRAELGDLLLFAKVTLANGSQVTFPGTAAYPAGYDPRQRPWYQAAREAFDPGAPTGGAVVWNNPAVDAVTGQVTITLSKPLCGPGGRFLGVASLDVPLARVLQEQEIASQWSEAMRTFVVAPAVNPATGRPALFTWAQRASDRLATDWKSALNFERIASPDRAGFEALVAAIKRGGSGAAELAFGDEDAFWAYSRFLNEAFFLIIVPKSMLAPLADQASQEIVRAVSRLSQLFGGAMVLALGAATVAALWITKSFTRPMAGMIEAWKKLGNGDFSVRLAFRMSDERQLLVNAFNETVPVLADHLRLQRSLELAQEVQRNLLPAAPPEVPGLDIAGAALPCDETGGDYFDYRAVTRGGEVCLDAAVGDVTGHGVPSALLMATARALLLATEDSETPAERVTRANRLLCRDVGDSGRFMTLFAVEVRPVAGIAHAVRAGHDPAMVYDPAADAFAQWAPKGLPLGIEPGYAYAEAAMPFDRPGLVLVIGTDGIWEARDVTGAMYGKERLMDVIRRTAGWPAQAILEAVLADLAAFRGAAHQEDDVTLMVIKKA
ncbi:MAG: SpoIIE family protein phosphatase [Solidesulfovibrio sp. DCME]|uniref:SpoIIE family protein phosphatase n=1 Tax=Solidesulfovibrio sp. DCME TaxID=3447380 RepID=UPI003D0FA996